MSGVWASVSSFDEKMGSHSLLSASPMPAQRSCSGESADGGVDEAVVCELRVIILAEGAVCIINHGDGGDGSAVRRNGREGKERLIELIGNILAGIAGAAAAIAKIMSAFCTSGFAISASPFS